MFKFFKNTTAALPVPSKHLVAPGCINPHLKSQTAERRQKHLVVPWISHDQRQRTDLPASDSARPGCVLSLLPVTSEGVEGTLEDSSHISWMASYPPAPLPHCWECVTSEPIKKFIPQPKSSRGFLQSGQDDPESRTRGLSLIPVCCSPAV